MSATGCCLPRCVGESFCWVEDCKLFASSSGMGGEEEGATGGKSASI